MLFLGAPGVGKGTFASRVGPALDLPHVSTGDLVRAEIRAGSDLGQEIKAINDRGELVSDEIIIAMLKKRMQDADCAKGSILDGFPRTEVQAESLEANGLPLQLAVQFVLPEDIIVYKAVSRRVCDQCGNTYNYADVNEPPYVMGPLLPQVMDKCDKCPGTLVQRQDDTEETVRKRLRIYEEHTAPLLSFYRKRGILTEFPVWLGVKDMPRLMDHLREHLDV